MNIELPAHRVLTGTVGDEVRLLLGKLGSEVTHAIVHIDTRDHTPSITHVCVSDSDMRDKWDGLITPMQAEHVVVKLEKEYRDVRV